MINPMFIDDIFTVKTMHLPAISSPVIVPLLQFPRFFIDVVETLEAAADREEQFVLSTYRFETAPDAAFSSWLRSTMATHNALAVQPRIDLETMFQSREPHWTLEERWKAVNAMAEAGIEVPRYLSKKTVEMSTALIAYSFSALEVQG